jgi:hypothetical protein
MELLSIKDSRHVHKKRDISIAFIEVIITYINQIQNSTDKKVTRPLMGGLDMALRILTGSHVTFISERILRRIKDDKLDLNPFELIWEQRHSMGQILVKNRKHSFAVWEHALPIREFRESLITATNKEEIIHIINEYPGVAWISREENNELNALGYQRKRPDGFLQCYEEAGITLLNESIYNHKVYNNT